MARLVRAAFLFGVIAVVAPFACTTSPRPESPGPNASAAIAVSVAPAPPPPDASVPAPAPSATVSVAPDPFDATRLGELRVVARWPSWGAEIAGGTAIVVEPDFLTLAGYDRMTGAPKWRVQAVDKEPGGRHSLHVAGTRAIYWAGNQMIGFEPATGRILSRETVSWNGEDCGFHRSGDACAFSCGCSTQLATCDTGRAIGPRFDKTYVEMFGPAGESPHAGCYDIGQGLVAGAAGIAVMEVEDKTASPSGHFGHPHVMLGLDASSGREIWRSASLARSIFSSGGGIVGHFAYQESSEGELLVFDVRTGRVTAHEPGAQNLGRVARRNLQVDVASKRLFHSLESQATLLDPATGAIAWTRALPSGALALLEGGAVESYGIGGGDKPLDIVVLEPKAGAIRSRFTIPPRGYIHADPGGGFYVSGDTLVGYDASGTERARASPMSPPNVNAGPDYAWLFSNEELALHDRRDLKKLGVLTGSYSVEEGSALASTLILYRFIDKGRKPGEAILLRRASP